MQLKKSEEAIITRLNDIVSALSRANLPFEQIEVAVAPELERAREEMKHFSIILEQDAGKPVFRVYDHGSDWLKVVNEAGTLTLRSRIGRVKLYANIARGTSYSHSNGDLAHALEHLAGVLRALPEDLCISGEQSIGITAGEDGEDEGADAHREIQKDLPIPFEASTLIEKLSQAIPEGTDDRSKALRRGAISMLGAVIHPLSYLAENHPEMGLSASNESIRERLTIAEIRALAEHDAIPEDVRVIPGSFLQELTAPYRELPEEQAAQNAERMVKRLAEIACEGLAAT